MRRFFFVDVGVFDTVVVVVVAVVAIVVVVVIVVVVDDVVDDAAIDNAKASGVVVNVGVVPKAVVLCDNDKVIDV